MSEQDTNSRRERQVIEEEALRKKERLKTLMTMVIGASASMVTVVMAAFFFITTPTQFFRIATTALASIATLIVVMAFLPFALRVIKNILIPMRSKPMTWESSASIERDFGSQIETLSREFSKTASIEAQKAAGSLVDSVDSQIAEQLKEKIGDIIDNNVVSLVGGQIAKASEEHYWRQQMQENLTDRFNTSRSRIDDLAKRSARSASVFRATGFILALSGLGALGWKMGGFYSVEFSTYIGEWRAHLATHAVTTFPFVFFAEVLALVMFRYSSRAQEQTRYYANEVTTLHLRLAAGLLILQQGTKEEIVSYAQELGRLERNRIVAKGETALEPPNHGDGAADEMIRKITRGVVSATTEAGKES